jgi:Ca2+-binding RTX toxin-like protein
LSAGTNAGGGIWNLTAAELVGLTFTPAVNYIGTVTLGVTLTSTDSNGSTSTASDNITITVDQTTNAILGDNLDNVLPGTAANDAIQGGDGVDTLSGLAGNDLLYGGNGGDFLYGGDGNDALYGGAGGDTLEGGAGTDFLAAGAGVDSVDGGAGEDVIIGGQGNDALTGGLLSDTFAWELGDGGTAGTPAIDTITDFDTAAAASGGDVLDLQDLLVGESSDTLEDFLYFESSGSDAILHISSTGGFSGGYLASAEDQTVVINDYDLSAYGGIQADIINDLINSNKLIIDG